jgi:hypothetical protein
MTTSGTYAYNPSLGDLTIQAFGMCGVRPTALTQEHLTFARTATNLMLSSWANRGVNLWKVDLVTVQLAQSPATLSASGNGTTVTLTYATPNTPIYAVGSSITVAGVTPSGYNGVYTVTASSSGSVSYASTTTGAQTVAGTITGANYAGSYSVDPNIVMILDAYVTTPNGSTNTDRIILPVSRTEYASYPNKQNVGFPTIYWFDRLINPTMTFWPIPSSSSGITQFSYYAVRQVQDSNYTSGQTIDIPYRWLEAFVVGLAARLAMIWNPALTQLLKPAADEAYNIAAQQDTEYVSMYISPQLSGYYR